MERIDKVLSNMGVGSRSEIREMARRGLITVDGEAILNSAYKIDPSRAQVAVSGNNIRLARFFYFMMNKPAGYLCVSRDGRDKTVINLLGEEQRKLKLFPAGRLDRDSEGFVLLTNDGAFAHALTAPRRNVDKRYYIMYKGTLAADTSDRFMRGVELAGGELCLPAGIEIDADNSAVVTVHEGRYHQVKRMIAACGGEVIYLKRLSIGPVELDPGLPSGGYRALTGDEVAALFAACSYGGGKY